jgi:uncharacterized protein (TIGR02147 family)
MKTGGLILLEKTLDNPCGSLENETMKRTKLDIFSYLDFRRFLKDRLEELREQHEKYSQRYFIKKLELSTNNYIQRIIEGKRNLSERLARKLTAVLHLQASEATFFLELVRYGQAKTTEQKTDALEGLRRNRRFKRVRQVDMDVFDYYSDPLTVALRDLVMVSGFQEDPSWILSKLAIKTTAKEIEEGLAKLERLGELQRDAKGKLKLAHVHQSTGEQMGSVPLRAYHLNMMGLAVQSMEMDPSVRHFRGVTMSIPPQAYKKVVDSISRCVEDVRDIVERHRDQEHVYHLEMALFPLTKRSPEKSRDRKK